MARLKLPKADKIKFIPAKKDNLTTVTYIINGCKAYSFNAEFYPKLLKRIISCIQRFLSNPMDDSFTPIIFRNQETSYKLLFIPTGMNVFQSAYGKVSEPWMGMFFEYQNTKKNCISTIDAHGTKKDILGALYDLVIQIDHSYKNEEIESLLHTNLFEYYERIAGSDWDNNEYKTKLSQYELKVMSITNRSLITAEDGCGNKFSFIDEEFKRHSKSYKQGEIINQRVTFNITSIQECDLEFSKNSVSNQFTESGNFEEFPEYDFCCKAYNCENGRDCCYAFQINLPQQKNTTRAVDAVIKPPYGKNISDGDIVKGRGYFQLEKLYSSNYYKYGK